MYVIFSGWSVFLEDVQKLGVVSPHLPGEILRAALVNFSRFSLVFNQFWSMLVDFSLVLSQF